MSDFGKLSIDLHAHLLPGIDDGPKTEEESKVLLKGLLELGFEYRCATPHISHEYYPNTRDTIQDARNRLTKALVGKERQYDLHATAAEYLLDDEFLPKIAEGNLLTLPGNRVLFELPFNAAPDNLEEVVFNLRIEGYRPILAHPERYLYWSGNKTKWVRLKEMGCQFQVNLPSFLNQYGKAVRKNAYAMIKAGVVDFLATDCHNAQQLSRLREGLRDQKFAKVILSNEFVNHQLISS